MDVRTTAMALMETPELRKMTGSHITQPQTEPSGSEEAAEAEIDINVSGHGLMPELSPMEAEPSEELVAEMEVNPLIDADGCVETLYHYLWKKDSKGRSCPGILLPDTIIYKHQRMNVWYFTSGKDPRKILMRKRRSTNHAEILKRFLKKENRSGVQSCYLSSSTTRPQVDDPENVKHEKLTVDVEYHDVHQLRDFLRRSRVGEHSILQRFVDGKGEYHTVIRATWSPQVCLLERRTSAERLCDRRRDIYRRCSTFDASLHDTPQCPMVGDALTSLIKGACNNIVNHVESVTKGAKRITRMVLYFTQDENASRLWFRWCTCIRVETYQNDFSPARPISLASTSMIAKYTNRKSVSEIHQRRLEALQHELANNIASSRNGNGSGEDGSTSILPIADRIEAVLLSAKHAVLRGERGSGSTTSLETNNYPNNSSTRSFTSMSLTVHNRVDSDRKYKWNHTEDLSKKLAPELIFHCPICTNYCRIESGVPVQHSVVLRAGSEFMSNAHRNLITQGDKVKSEGSEKTHMKENESLSEGDMKEQNKVNPQSHNDVSQSMESSQHVMSEVSRNSAFNDDSLQSDNSWHPLSVLASNLSNDVTVLKHCHASIPLNSPELARETLLCETCCLLCNDEVMNGLVATKHNRENAYSNKIQKRSSSSTGQVMGHARSHQFHNSFMSLTQPIGGGYHSTSLMMPIRSIPIVPVRGQHLNTVFASMSNTSRSFTSMGAWSGSTAHGATTTKRPWSVPKCAFQQTEFLQRRFADTTNTSTPSNNDGAEPSDNDTDTKSIKRTPTPGTNGHQKYEPAMENFRQIYGKKVHNLPSSPSTSGLSNTRTKAVKGVSGIQSSSTHKKTKPSKTSNLTSEEAAFLTQTLQS